MKKLLSLFLLAAVPVWAADLDDLPVHATADADAADFFWVIDDSDVSADAGGTGHQMTFGSLRDWFFANGSVAAATDLSLTASSGQDIKLVMGDAVGVQEVGFYDSTGTNRVAGVNSDGDIDVTNITSDRLDYAEQASVTNPDATKGTIYLDSDDNTFKGIVADEGNTLQTLLTDKTVIYETLYVDAGAMLPRGTNPAVIGSIDGTNVSADTWDFADGTELGVQFKVAMPDDWDEGTIKAKFYWYAGTGATPTTEGVTWGLSAQSIANDVDFDSAFAASVDTDDAVASVAADLHVSPASAAITVTGAGGINEIVFFELTRVVGDAQDNMTETAHLLGAEIQFGRTLDAAAW